MRHPKSPLTFLAALGLTACLAGTAVAQTPGKSAAAPAAPTDAKADPRAAIAKKFDGVRVEDVRISPVSGLYEVTRGSEISYVSADGKYAILGDMVDVDGDANLSENRRRTIRA